jgi:hypothetical protein
LQLALRNSLVCLETRKYANSPPGTNVVLKFIFPSESWLNIVPIQFPRGLGSYFDDLNNNQTTRLASGSLARLTLAVRLVAALVALTLSLGIEAVVGVSSAVAQVGVNTNELAAVLGNNAAHVDFARAVGVALAVAARAVDFAVVLGVEVDDVDGAAAVVLDHFVGGVVGATSNDVGGAVALETDGVLAHVFEPDVLQVAGAQAVDTLGLVFANNHIAESGAVFEDEDGVFLAALGLAFAGTAAAVVLGVS